MITTEGAVPVRVESGGRLMFAFARRPGEAGVAVSSDLAGVPARLEPGPEHLGGWIALDDGDPAEELGRTTPLCGPDGGETTMILRDGRVFRTIARFGARCSVAVCGWETPGAFLDRARDLGFDSVMLDPAWGRGGSLLGRRVMPGRRGKNTL